MRFTKSGMEWIESNGGPLLLIERVYAPLWGGIEFSSGSQEFADQSDMTDYDRACRDTNLMKCLQVSGHDALVLGMPFFTAVWQRVPEEALILAVQYRDPDVNIHGLIDSIRSKGLNPVSETSRITVGSGDITIFDSAYPGSETIESIDMQCLPGQYDVEAGELKEDGIGGVIYRFHKIN